ncbi:MAG: 50S ribosomal protein L25 [Saccharofermentanales bacterium]
MADLQSKKRDMSVKGKKLRREGIIPCVLYGKHLSEPINLQVTQKDAEHFLKGHTSGSKLELTVGRKNHMVLLKEITYVPVSNAVEHMSFMDLTAGEKVTASAHVILLHKDKVDGIIQHSISDISYSALPQDLIESIEIDMTDYKHGAVIKVRDLPIAGNDKLEIHTPLDDIIISIAAAREMIEEPVEGEEPVEIKISGTTISEADKEAKEPGERKEAKAVSDSDDTDEKESNKFRETKATKSRMTKETKETLVKEKNEAAEE